MARGRTAISLSSQGADEPTQQQAGGRTISHRLVFPRGLRPAIAVIAAAGAVLLLVSEFTTLYGVHIASRAGPIQVISGGSNNSYAMVPVAILGLFLVLAGIGGGGRWALGALALVGVVSLLIGLLGDLPGAHESNHLIRYGGRFVLGNSQPSIGMYLETLGAVLLIVAGGLGLLVGQPRAAVARGPRSAGGGAAGPAARGEVGGAGARGEIGGAGAGSAGGGGESAGSVAGGESAGPGAAEES